MKTIAELFSSLSALVASAITIGFPVPDRTVQGVKAMDAQIAELAENGVDMDPNHVIVATGSITRICGSLTTGLVGLLSPFVMDRAQKAQRSIAAMESNSYIIRKFFADELESLKTRLSDLLDFVSARKASEIDDEQFVVNGVELLGFIYEETAQLEAKVVAFKRRGAEMREAQEREEIETKQVKVSAILASLGRPVATARTGGRSADKREQDRARRGEMRGSSSSGGSKKSRRVA